MEYLIALIALTAMEIVLGIDNIVFIAVITGRLPEQQRDKARRLGLGLAMIARILLLLTLSAVLKLEHPLLTLQRLGIPEDWMGATVVIETINNLSVKDLILFFGGLFLIQSSVREIHAKLEGRHEEHAAPETVTMRGVLARIAVLDIIFSLDSVITAVGMVKAKEPDESWIALGVMVTAIVLAVVVMLVFASKVSSFVERYPTLKMLALSFLILIGVMLVAEGIGAHFDKKYIYFAMAFSLVVEMLNIRVRARKSRTATA